MEQCGSCEGSYRNSTDGKIYQYSANYSGLQSVTWSMLVSWGQQSSFRRSGTVTHNILTGHSLQELIRAHVLADLQQALNAQALAPAVREFSGARS